MELFEKASSYFKKFLCLEHAKTQYLIIEQGLAWNHQIKRCTAPCVNLISEKDYKKDILIPELNLGGKDSAVVSDLTKRMNEHSEKFNYERAAIFRDRIQSLRQIRLKQSVSDFSEKDADIISYESSLGQVCVNVVMIRGGRHLGDKSFFPKNNKLAEEKNIIEIFISQYYDQKPPPPVLVSEETVNRNLINDFFELKNYPAVKIITKLRADKRMWMIMAKKNASEALKQKNSQQASQLKRLESFRDLLSVSNDTNRIECFDISHTMGEGTVASCVVYDKNSLQNKEYRRYNIKDITPGDDYGAMKEVLERRYEKIIATDGLKPDVILIDGGKGQLS